VISRWIFCAGNISFTLLSGVIKNHLNRLNLLEMANMALTGIDKELLKYIMQMDETQKKSLLAHIKTFLSPGPGELIDLASYNKQLEEAMGRVGRGEFTTLEDLEKEMRSW
jgi:hypothetical protein